MRAGGLISYEEYSPYGNTTYQAGRSAAEVSLKRYRYTGKERDEENGFTYHGARYYAPWLGRWTAVDPAGIKGGQNLYAYANVNPVGQFDPSGLAPVTPPTSGVLRRLGKIAIDVLVVLHNYISSPESQIGDPNNPDDPANTDAKKGAETARKELGVRKPIPSGASPPPPDPAPDPRGDRVVDPHGNELGHRVRGNAVPGPITSDSGAPGNPGGGPPPAPPGGGDGPANGPPPSPTTETPVPPPAEVPPPTSAPPVEGPAAGKATGGVTGEVVGGVLGAVNLAVAAADVIKSVTKSVKAGQYGQAATTVVTTVVETALSFTAEAPLVGAKAVITKYNSDPSIKERAFDVGDDVTKFTGNRVIGALAAADYAVADSVYETGAGLVKGAIDLEADYLDWVFH